MSKRVTFRCDKCSFKCIYTTTIQDDEKQNDIPDFCPWSAGANWYVSSTQA